LNKAIDATGAILAIDVIGGAYFSPTLLNRAFGMA
jgi:hypothetical protein